MSQAELLVKIVKLLDLAPIPYMVTGSHASSALGQPRSTHDIDFVVQMGADNLQYLMEAFADDRYRLDELAARNAIAQKGMFQLEDFGDGDKVDFWMLQDHPFDQESFKRRIRGLAAGTQVYLPTAEDHIIQKLRWAHDYESEKQYNDALLLYELYATKLDTSYVLKWVFELKIQPTWERMLAEAEPLR